MSHFSHLSRLVPDLSKKTILDIGAGEGRFSIEAAQAGARVTALEYYQGHIDIASRAAAEAGVSITFIQGEGEALPFPDESFGFANISEVLEHVSNPEQVLKEAYRVLLPGSSAYVSIPNRFALRDPHYHLYFVNWMPRSWAEKIINVLHKHKEGEDLHKGYQSLTEMYYATYGNARCLLERAGFVTEDIREQRIRNEYSAYLRPLALAVYYFLRVWHYDSFHFLLTKPVR